MIRIFLAWRLVLLTFNIIARNVLGKSRGISAQLFPLKAAWASQAANGWSKKLWGKNLYWDMCALSEISAIMLNVVLSAWKKNSLWLSQVVHNHPKYIKKISHKCSWSKHLAVFCTSFFICWKIVLTFGPDGPLVGPLLDPRLFCFIWARFEEL